MVYFFYFFFFQAEDGIRDKLVTGVQTCALPILARPCAANDLPVEVHEEQVLRSHLLESHLVGFHPEGVGPGDAHGGVSPDVVALAGPGQNAAGLGEPLPEVGRTASRLSHPHSLRGSSDREPDLVETVARRSRLT